MLKLLAPVVATLAGDELKLLTGRAKRAAIFAIAVAIFGLIAIVFLCVAAFLALSENYSGPVAALILSGLSLIVVLLILAVLKIQAAAEEKKTQRAYCCR